MKMPTIIGQNIRAYREAKGWTQAELASRCGVSRGHMNDLERRSQHISVWTLKRIADELGCGLLVDDLITTNPSRRAEMVSHLETTRSGGRSQAAA